MQGDEHSILTLVERQGIRVGGCAYRSTLGGPSDDSISMWWSNNLIIGWFCKFAWKHQFGLIGGIATLFAAF